TFVSSVARLLVTSVTGMLNEWGGYGLAFSLAAAVALISLVVILPVPDQRHPPRRPSLGSLTTLITRPDVLLPALLSAVGQYVNWAAIFGFLPILAQQLGASDLVLSLMTSLSVIMVAFGNWATTYLVRRLGARNLSYLSFGLLGIGV